MPLIDRLWPRAAIALLALAAVVAVVGVAAAPSRSPQDKIEDVLHDFADDVANHRGEKACNRLTDTAQKAVAAEVGTLSCGDVVRTFGLGFDPASLAASHLTNVAVVGDQAAIAVPDLVQPGGAPFGHAFALQKVHGDWRIAVIR